MPLPAPGMRFHSNVATALTDGIVLDVFKRQGCFVDHPNPATDPQAAVSAVTVNAVIGPNKAAEFERFE